MAVFQIITKKSALLLSWLGKTCYLLNRTGSAQKGPKHPRSRSLYSRLRTPQMGCQVCLPSPLHLVNNSKPGLNSLSSTKDPRSTSALVLLHALAELHSVLDRETWSRLKIQFTFWDQVIFKPDGVLCSHLLLESINNWSSTAVGTGQGSTASSHAIRRGDVKKKAQPFPGQLYSRLVAAIFGASSFNTYEIPIKFSTWFFAPLPNSQGALLLKVETIATAVTSM